MSRLRVAPIVEGHGEVQAIRPLISRIWTELIGGEFVEVLTPIRQPRSRLVQEDHLARAVRLAGSKLRSRELPADPAIVLLLLDADRDAPCQLGPSLLQQALMAAPGLEICCVVAKIEYETWFVAAAESLDHYLVLPDHTMIPPRPEEAPAGKGWIKQHFKGTRYSETVDQPAMTARMDLHMCRLRSPSFDKLCRDLTRYIRPPQGA